MCGSVATLVLQGSRLRKEETELEDEYAWLRYRVRRLRAIVHRIKDREAARLLSELILEAEDRLDLLERIQVNNLLK